MCDVVHVDTVVRFISLPSDRFLCNAACEKNRSASCSHSFHVPVEIFPQAASIVCFALSALLICCLLPTFLLTYHHIFTTCMIELMPFSSSSNLVSYSGSKHACNWILLLWNAQICKGLFTLHRNEKRIYLNKTKSCRESFCMKECNSWWNIGLLRIYAVGIFSWKKCETLE